MSLILVHLVAISHQVDRGGGSMLERVVFSMLSPVQNVVAVGVRSVKSAWYGYVDLRGARNESARLHERLRVLEIVLQEKQHLAREAERLRQLMGLQEVLPMETLVAEVVARDGLPWFRTLTINRGTKDGVTLNAPVLSPTGVLGRVIGVGPHAAKVQLLLDRQAGVGVQLQRTGVTGVTEGQVGLADSNARELVIKYMPSLADVEIGDIVVTSGLDQIFPKGYMVGRVSKVEKGSGLFKEIYVSPSAQFDAVEEVLVVKTVSTLAVADSEKVR